MAVRYQRAADLVELTGILQTTASGLTIDEIAERFEVSRRTAERMLGALRQRFPELQPDLRGGRKFWKLSSRAARPIQLPRTVDALSERIAELEAEVDDSRNELASLRAITDGVMSTAPVGLMILDPNGKILRTSDALSEMFGVPREAFEGHPVSEVFGGHLRSAVGNPDELIGKLLGDRHEEGDDGFECHVLAADGRPERWLRRWGRRIVDGPYAGGRIDRWVDVSASRAHAQTVDRLPPFPETTTQVLNEHLAGLQEATARFVRQHALAPDVEKRLHALMRSHQRTIETSLEVVTGCGIKRETMEPREALEIARMLIQPWASDRTVAIRVEVDPDLTTMFGDRALSVSSLVLNAKLTLEAVPQGSTLVLRAARMQDPARVRVSLIDDGPSLPEGFPEFLGEFYATQEGGTGIGLQPARDANGVATGGIEQYFELPIG